MTKQEAAKRAAALVRSGWTQKSYARRANGEATGFSDPLATCYCASGAIYKALGATVADFETPEDAATALQIRLDFKRIAGAPVIWFNDKKATSGEDVALIFDQIAAGK